MPWGLPVGAPAGGGGLDLASGLPFVGAGLSALSGFLGAEDQNRNYDDAVEEQNMRSGYAEHLRGQQLYGPAYTAYAAKLYQALRTAQSGDTSALDALARSPEFAAYQKATGGPLVQQYQNLGNKVIGKQNANLASYDADTARLGGADDAYARRLDELSQGMEGMARGYGAGRRKEIDTDSRMQLDNMDDVSRAALASAGLSNSSAVANQLSGNRTAVGREKQRAVNDVADRQTTMMMGARGQRINTAAAAGAGGLNRAYGRASDRTSLLNQNLARIMAVRTAPLELMNSGTYSPMGVLQNTGTSGASALLASAGNSAGAFGGYLQGQNGMADLLRQLQSLRTAA